MQIGMGYFILVKEGPHFTALPVKDWYNFRPSVRYMMFMQVKKMLLRCGSSSIRMGTSRNQAMTLEEAERQMNSRGAPLRLAAGSKLGALAAKGKPLLVS